MEITASPIKNLPSELLFAILAKLNTKELLPVVAVSRRFCSLATRILHRRLITTTSQPGNEVILECYHPSAKISTPYLACRYIGTASCDAPSIDEQNPNFVQLRRMYSCFRPVVMEENRRKRFRYGWSVRTLAGSTQLQIAAEDLIDETAHQEVYLDEGERFSQLCTVTNVVTHGSRPGLFTRHVNISEGVIRVFRDWLSSMLSRQSTTQSEASSSLSSFSSSSSSTTTPRAAIAGSGTFSSNDGRILWVDRAKDIGLRFKVTLGQETRGTIFEDEPPVSYNLIYEELIIRTSTLLLAVEEAAVKHVAHSGTDIIIATI